MTTPRQVNKSKRAYKTQVQLNQQMKDRFEDLASKFVALKERSAVEEALFAERLAQISATEEAAVIRDKAYKKGVDDGTAATALTGITMVLGITSFIADVCQGIISAYRKDPNSIKPILNLASPFVQGVSQAFAEKPNAPKTGDNLIDPFKVGERRWPSDSPPTRSSRARGGPAKPSSTKKPSTP